MAGTNRSSEGSSSPTARSLTASLALSTGTLAIGATQLLGLPFKDIDKQFFDAYMAFTKQNFAVLVAAVTQAFSPTIIRVSQDASMPQELFREKDGSLKCTLPPRLVIMANHQLYTDWLYLWFVAYCNGMHGFVHIILKEALKKLPIVGWSCNLYNFIFLSRKWEADKKHFAIQLDKLNQDPQKPMWLIIFPEGTNLSATMKAKSAAWAKKQGIDDMKHQLLPRTKGLQLCLHKLAKTTEYLYDCTIAYEGIPPGAYGQDIFTLKSSMFEGKPPKSVNMHFRRFRVSAIPYTNDQAFEVWSRNRWREKDYLLEYFAAHGRFPENLQHLRDKLRDGGDTSSLRKAASNETRIGTRDETEVLDILTPFVMGLMLLKTLSKVQGDKAG